MRFRCFAHSSSSMCNEFCLTCSCTSIRAMDCLRRLWHTTDSAIIFCRLCTSCSSWTTSSYNLNSSSSRHSSTPSLRVRFDSRVCASAKYASLSLMVFFSFSIVSCTSSTFLTVCKQDCIGKHNIQYCNVPELISILHRYMNMSVKARFESWL